MLLARLGHRVLLVDRSHFPSDTVSTHHLHQTATGGLARWGLLIRVAASDCPPTYEIQFDVEGVRFAGTPPAPEGIREAYSVRRRVLDSILIDGAVEAGVEFRDRFAVKDLLFEQGRVIGIEGRSEGGRPVRDRAPVVVGADGLRSTVARIVEATVYGEVAPLTHTYYAYWSDVPAERLELYGRVGGGAAVDPTNDGLTMVALGVATWDQPDVRHDIEGSYVAALRAVPDLAERVLAGHREERLAGMSNIPNFFRQATGPGWALAGDAGYHKDPSPAQGISDAFRDAEMLTDAVHAGLVDGGIDERLAGFAARRDELAGPWYRWTARSFAYRPLEEPARRLLESIAERRDLTDLYAGIYAETVSPQAFREALGRPA
jgi:flavin-dependent dehydrogenase